VLVHNDADENSPVYARSGRLRIGSPESQVERVESDHTSRAVSSTLGT
jgi:hypothetical protein